MNLSLYVYNMFLYTRKVHLYETDLGQVVHHSNYWRYLEESRHNSFAQLGFLDSETMSADLASWVVYDVQMTYLKPLRYLDQVLIFSRATVDKLKIRFEYLTFQTTEKQIHANLFLQQIFNTNFLYEDLSSAQKNDLIDLLKQNMTLVNKAKTDIVLVSKDMRAQRIPQPYKEKFGETKWTETWL